MTISTPTESSGTDGAPGGGRRWRSLTVAQMDLVARDMALDTFDATLAGRRAALRGGEPPLRAGEPAGGAALARRGARAGRPRAEMEAVLTEAARPRRPDDPRVQADAWGRVRATYLTLREDRQALRSCARASRCSSQARAEHRVVVPGPDTVGAAAGTPRRRPRLACPSRDRRHRAWSGAGSGRRARAARRVVLGRQGRRDADADTAAAADAALTIQNARAGRCTPAPGGEAAVRDGGANRQAGCAKRRRSSRPRLRPGRPTNAAPAGAAGAPVMRRGRGQSTVPPALRRLGITSRELDVLVSSRWAAHREIAARLFLSPRTVEHHVAACSTHGHRTPGRAGPVRRQIGWRPPLNWVGRRPMAGRGSGSTIVGMETTVHEIADGVYRLSTYCPTSRRGFTINQFLLDADEPLLFHCGCGAFRSCRACPGWCPCERLRWISFGHVEADECGSMNQWLDAARRRRWRTGSWVPISIADMADRRRVAGRGRGLDIGGHRLRRSLRTCRTLGGAGVFDERRHCCAGTFTDRARAALVHDRTWCPPGDEDMFQHVTRHAPRCGAGRAGSPDAGADARCVVRGRCGGAVRDRRRVRGAAEGGRHGRGTASTSAGRSGRSLRCRRSTTDASSRTPSPTGHGATAARSTSS